MARRDGTRAVHHVIAVLLGVALVWIAEWPPLRRLWRWPLASRIVPIACAIAVTIADAANAARLAQQPDECLIARTSGTFVFLRVPTPEQFEKLRCTWFESASQ
jgi:hypothetical protein